MGFKNKNLKKRVIKIQGFIKAKNYKNLNFSVLTKNFSVKLKETFLRKLKSTQKFKINYSINKTRNLYNQIKKKTTESNLINYLSRIEHRLDNIVYNTYILSNRFLIKHLISHGKIFVNKKRVKSRSFITTKNSIITFSKTIFPLLRENLKENDLIFLIPNFTEINYNIFTLVILFDKLNVFSLLAVSPRFNGINLSFLKCFFLH